MRKGVWQLFGRRLFGARRANDFAAAIVILDLIVTIPPGWNWAIIFRRICTEADVRTHDGDVKD